MKGYKPVMSFGEDVAAMCRDVQRGDENAAVAFLEELAGRGPVVHEDARGERHVCAECRAVIMVDHLPGDGPRIAVELARLGPAASKRRGQGGVRGLEGDDLTGLSRRAVLGAAGGAVISRTADGLRLAELVGGTELIAADITKVAS